MLKRSILCGGEKIRAEVIGTLAVYDTLLNRKLPVKEGVEKKMGEETVNLRFIGVDALFTGNKWESNSPFNPAANPDAKAVFVGKLRPKVVEEYPFRCMHIAPEAFVTGPLPAFTKLLTFLNLKMDRENLIRAIKIRKSVLEH
jgi:hypothetical protein